MSGAAAVAPPTVGVTITTVSRHLWTSSGLGRVLLDRQADCHAEIAQRRVIALHALTQPEDRRAGGDDRAVLARGGVLDERVHLGDEALRLELHGILVHGRAHLGTPAFHEGATAAAQSREHPAGASLRHSVASSRPGDPAQAVLELRDAAGRGAQSVQETFLFGTGRQWRRRGLGARRVGDRRLRSERDRGETEQHGQAAHQDPLGVTRSHGYNVTMTVPATSRQTRTFEDRADALAHFFLRAGEAPRLLAYDDAVGCPRSEEHTSELQSQSNLVCRLLLEKIQAAVVHLCRDRVEGRFRQRQFAPSHLASGARAFSPRSPLALHPPHSPAAPYHTPHRSASP